MRRRDGLIGPIDCVGFGWQRFGYDWEKIQRNVLPTKTANQIFVRFKNQTSKRADPNPIKVPDGGAPYTMTLKSNHAILML